MLLHGDKQFITWTIIAFDKYQFITVHYSEVPILLVWYNLNEKWIL